MISAYSSVERAKAHLQHLEDNEGLIKTLRTKMTGPGFHMADRVLAFAELHRLYDGDAYMQRRLIINLEYAAKRHLEMEAL